MASSALAQTNPESEQAPDPHTRYTAPFQLRSVVPRNGLRVDSTMATYTRVDIRGAVAVALISAQARLGDNAALQARWGFVDHSAGAHGESKMGVVNPTAGVLFATRLSRVFRLALSVTLGLPLGTGGGNAGDPQQVQMQRQAALARSSMDNTSFAVNDLGIPVGLSLAYVERGLTAQLDATVIPSVRLKGDRVQSDADKVNATSGFFVSQLVLPNLALGFELRYQRFLSTPATVVADPETRENLTAALGARLFVDLAGDVVLRPALSYGRSVRGAGLQQAVQAVQLDLPLSF